MTIVTILPLLLLAIPCVFAVGVVLASLFRVVFASRRAATVALPRAIVHATVRPAPIRNPFACQEDAETQLFVRRAFAR